MPEYVERSRSSKIRYSTENQKSGGLLSSNGNSKESSSRSNHRRLNSHFSFRRVNIDFNDQESGTNHYLFFYCFSFLYNALIFLNQLSDSLILYNATC